MEENNNVNNEKILDNLDNKEEVNPPKEEQLEVKPIESTEPVEENKISEPVAEKPVAKFDKPYRGRAPYSGSSTKPKNFRPNKFRRKFCRFCYQEDLEVDYKDSELLEKFITERGKIFPRRVTGTCSKHQRLIAKAIKRARILALLPFIEQ